MAIKVLKIGLVSVLALVLIGGGAYILLRPTEARASNVEQGRVGGQGNSRGTRDGLDVDAGENCGAGDAQGFAGPGRGQGRGVMIQNPRCDDAVGESAQGRGRELEGGGQGLGNQGEGSLVWSQAEAPAWETIQGLVIEAGNELLVKNDDGELLVGLGQAFYREEQSFEVSIDDEVEVRGYVEDDEFKAGTVENLTTGESIVLRDDLGRPMWSGRGNNQNRP